MFLKYFKNKLKVKCIGSASCRYNNTGDDRGEYFSLALTRDGQIQTSTHNHPTFKRVKSDHSSPLCSVETLIILLH